MAFYLNPPSGLMPLSMLQECAVRRLKFLKKLSELEGDYSAVKDFIDDPSSVEQYGSYLMVGSKNDRVGHFFLRLVSAHDPAMTSFFITMEICLFQFRFNCMSKAEIVSLFSSLKRDIRKILSQDRSYPELSRYLLMLQQSLKLQSDWRRLVNHYLLGDQQPCISVPFTCALGLVSRRFVLMDRGVAHVACDKLGILLTDLYRDVLDCQMGIARTLKRQNKEDTRLTSLASLCKFLCRQRMYHHEALPTSSVTSCSLSHDQIDGVIGSFPPCMVRLHRQLRLNHRLPHVARVRYTLYLKEIGLPVHEAVKFWRMEYCQPAPPGCTYGSEWGPNDSRYTYNIRHLYGLEGSKVNYRGHDCAKIQEVGGCPYSDSQSEQTNKQCATSMPPPNRPCYSCTKFLLTDVENLAIKQYASIPSWNVDLKTRINPSVRENEFTGKGNFELESNVTKIIRSPLNYFNTHQNLVQSLS